MSSLITVLLLVTYAHLPFASGEFRCYSCVMTGGTADSSCLNNPAGVSTGSPVVICPYKYCTIIRQEYMDPAGQIYTFYRGCTPYSDEGISEGGGYKVYTRVCTANLCNNWDGISSGPPSGSGGGGGGSVGGGGIVGGGGFGINDPGYVGVLYVKGTGWSGAQRTELCVTPIAFVVLLKLFR